MRFRPVGKRALVKTVEQEEMTASGIVLPHAARKKPRTAKVVAVGRSENRVRLDEDGVVVFARYSGWKIDVDGEETLILDCDDLLGVVEEWGRFLAWRTGS